MNNKQKKNEVKFYLKNKTNGKGTIFAIFYFGYREDGKNKPFQLSTGERIDVRFWDEDYQHVIKDPNVEWREINKSITKTADKIIDAYDDLLLHKSKVTPEILKKAIDKTSSANPSKPPEKITLIGYAKQYLKICGKDWKTVRNYNTTLNYLIAFSKYKRRTLDFDNIDMIFYREFVKYMFSLNKRINTVGGHIKNLKVFLRESYHQKVHNNGSFMHRDFKVLEEEVDSIYLTQPELTRMYQLDLSKHPTLEQTRDAFIIEALTGLRYSDLENLRKANVGMDRIIRILTIKTQEKVCLPIGPTVQNILNKYSPNLPRVLCNAKFNGKLKIIAKLAKLNNWETITRSNGGIHKAQRILKYWLVSSHTARRSFATNLILAGVDSSKVRAFTGHKTEKSFWKYVKIKQTQNAHELIDHPYLNLEEQKIITNYV